MIRTRLAAILFAAFAPVFAQGPQLKPGEAFITMDADGKVHGWGDVKTPRPLGEMAKLVWLKMAGADWVSLEVYWDCKNPGCLPPKGHGHVDLRKAYREDCDDAFLYWINWERKDWVEQQGEGVTRIQLMTTFGPFLGDRVPKEGGLPDFTPDWIGRSDLLQASPEAFITWVAAPENQIVLSLSREFLKGFFASAADSRSWWFKPGVSSQGTWVLAGDGQSEALLFISMPETPKEAVQRMKDIMGAGKSK
ncbi:MAG TPA: hypothetical protein VL181_09525 [Holophagaceae bacterium]|nr:hypothetical protein [Holophagaceae bacterium]